MWGVFLYMCLGCMCVCARPHMNVGWGLFVTWLHRPYSLQYLLTHVAELCLPVYWSIPITQCTHTHMYTHIQIKMGEKVTYSTFCPSACSLAPVPLLAELYSMFIHMKQVYTQTPMTSLWSQALILWTNLILVLNCLNASCIDTNSPIYSVSFASEMRFARNWILNSE